MSVRIKRMQAFLKQEIAQILQQETSDPRLQFISVTRVAVSRDLRFAKVFVSALHSDTKLSAIMDALGNVGGRVQTLIAPRLSTRFVPKITFQYDDGLRQSVELGQLIDQAIQEDESHHAEAEGAAPAEPPPKIDPHQADVEAGLG
jgi:ribosome-binding factor A